MSNGHFWGPPKEMSTKCPRGYPERQKNVLKMSLGHFQDFFYLVGTLGTFFDIFFWTTLKVTIRHFVDIFKGFLDFGSVAGLAHCKARRQLDSVQKNGSEVCSSSVNNVATKQTRAG